MVGAIEGLSYETLMNLPTDEFMEVRSNVVSICAQRNADVKRMRRG